MTTPTFDVDQAGWGSRFTYPDGTKTPWTPDKSIIHWGGATDPGVGLQSYEAKVLRGWQRYHVDVRGWTDIAYNYAIGDSGTIYRCRGENRSGATSGDYEDDGIPENEEARAIAWVGGQGHTPSAAAFTAFDRFLRSTDESLVIGHNDVKQTACPGPALTAYIDNASWTAPAVPTYRGVFNVPGYGEEAVDWGIAQGVINTTDEHPDDWDAPATYGTIWALMHRLHGKDT